MEVIEELNNIRVRFTFDDEKQEEYRKRRATIARSHDSFCSDNSGIPGIENIVGIRHMPLTSIPNERQTIQNELLERLEAINGLEATYIKTIPDGIPRLGIYTQEERVDRINAYREKRKKRVFGKVRYVLRKRASEGRSRFKGRFAKEDPNSPSASTPPNTNGGKSVEEVTADNLRDSTSWFEKMTLGAARRLSGSFSSAARRRSSMPARPTTPFEFEEEEVDKSGSWSSWLLKTRRKSEASGNSGRMSDYAGGSQPLPNPMNFQKRNSSPIHAAAALTATELDDSDLFFVENLEPDRKRLTSGSSALFNEIIFDPAELEASLIDTNDKR